MNSNQIETLKKHLGIELNDEKIKILEKYENLFLKKNAYTNLISKNDEKFLFEKHIFDSLAINLFFKGKNIESSKLLDIGTGGGFPSTPISIVYDNIQVFAIDSIRKKIKIIEELKSELKLKNLFPICDRVENLQIETTYDYITTRAVAQLEVILKYAVPKLKQGGYFIAYKSKNAINEIKEAEKTTKKLGVRIIDIIEYTLPLEENHQRNLIIFQK